MKKQLTPADAFVAWVKKNRPEMAAQVERWFNEKNAGTASLADLAMMGFEAGRDFTTGKLDRFAEAETQKREK